MRRREFLVGIAGIGVLALTGTAGGAGVVNRAAAVSERRRGRVSRESTVALSDHKIDYRTLRRLVKEL
ncbi:hypothetical protein [Haloarcula amylovorans]|uniref:hypothetical protein n=1 Tax=Haloarcula amylovorans TaxID=2562280 RepID=UPI0010767B0B|nr:hypothetical protein [Halomicroarcula amylolytica]